MTKDDDLNALANRAQLARFAYDTACRAFAEMPTTENADRMIAARHEFEALDEELRRKRGGA